MTPLDATHQAALQSSPHASAIIAAIEAAGLTVEFGNEGYRASDAGAAHAIIDDEIAWLPQYRAQRLGEVAVAFAAKIAAGFGYTGSDGVRRLFQLDQTSQFNIDVQANASLGAMLNGEAWNSGAYFIAADNSHMPTPTAADMRNFALAVRAYVSGLILTQRALKDAVLAAVSASALAALDITAGWPVNG